MEKQMNKKPIYKISATIVNSWLFYLGNPTDKNLDSFKDLIRGKFTENEFVVRGREYEQSVFDGKEGNVSKLVEGTLIQKWGPSSYIQFSNEGFSIRLSGKADSVDTVKSRIYDIKRTNRYDPNYYTDSSTCQHHFYFKLFSTIQDFYYVIAEGKEEVEAIHIEHKKRPSEEDLNKKVMDYLKGVITFIKEIGMWEEFKKYQEYKGAY